MKKSENKILCGDCINILSKYSEPFADLIFADPPFNIGYQYDKYKDRLKCGKYISWSRDWITACVNILKPRGSFYIAIGDEYAADLRIIGRELGLTLRNWIIWHYSFGQQTKAKFARSHTHILYFVKDDRDFTFNDKAVRVPSDRQILYNDKRSNPRGKLPDDVWNCFSRVCGTFNERLKWHPCQMPELLLARIISVSSNPDDMVLDPFNGSGTTAAVAKKLGRKYMAIDISQDYVKNTIKRLKDIDSQCRDKKTLFGKLNPAEQLELRRLFVEMQIPAQEILGSKKLIRLFANQYKLRLDRELDDELIIDQLMELTTWKV